MSANLIEVENLSKSYRQGFWMREVPAVVDVSFHVPSGEIFGFLGPNGAGKTTTIKMLTGLTSPSSGRARLFGLDVSRPAARQRLGFLPENPYVYPYLTPTEFVSLCGELSGLSSRVARARALETLKSVGIAYAADRPVQRLSKGMLQRTGIAAALVADPELLILDEPMSGLDPVGRKEVRDLIVDERRKGRTIFFSTHILTDVQTLCDRVAILRRGRLVVSGKLSELLRSETHRSVVTTELSESFQRASEAAGHVTEILGNRLVVRIEGEAALQQALAQATAAGVRIQEVTPNQETLEDLFLREAIYSGENPTT
jgi:ABC-2 type transport system ATP-binding protein